MIKILILFAIVLLSGALGIAAATEKKRRAKIFSEFYEFNEKLLLNLKYGREKVSKVAEEFESVRKVMDGNEVLKGEDGEFLKKYVSGIGETDAVTQVEYLNERKLALNEFKQKSQENYKKYGSLYVKLALMAGLLVAVLLA